MFVGTSSGDENAMVSVRLLGDAEMAEIIAENEATRRRADDPVSDNAIEGPAPTAPQSDASLPLETETPIEEPIEIPQAGAEAFPPDVPPKEDTEEPPREPLADESEEPTQVAAATADSDATANKIDVGDDIEQEFGPLQTEAVVAPASPIVADVVTIPAPALRLQNDTGPPEHLLEELSPGGIELTQNLPLREAPKFLVPRQPPSPSPLTIRQPSSPTAVGANERIPIQPNRPARYGLRSADRKQQALINILGRDDALVSVNLSLQWLQRNQEADGSWSVERHGGGRETYTLGENRRGAGMNADTGMTGLAILAFAGAGHDHTQGPYRDTIGNAIAYLIENQRTNGDLSGEASLFAAMYCHGMAGLALTELLAFTGDERLRGAVEQAVQFTIQSQDPNTGSWRYAAGDGQGDMSQFGWQVMLLTTAELSGIKTPETTKFRMLRFIDQMSSGHDGGLARYQRGHRPSRTMTAESMVCRQLLGIDVPVSAEREGFDYVAQDRPGQGKANLYYWYYASLAQLQYRAPGWKTWVSDMETQLRQRQRTAGDQAGSWDSDTVWGGYGGRVYATALGALCLEVFYRYGDTPPSNSEQIPHWTRQDGRWGPIRR